MPLILPAQPVGVPPTVSGHLMPPSNMVTTAATTVSTSGQTSWVYYDIWQPRTINGIGLNVTTAVAGGTTPAMRIGLYADDGTGARPGAIMVDAGTVTITAIALVYASVSLTLRPGRYWAAAAYTFAATPTTALGVHSLTLATPLPGGTWTNDYRCWLATTAVAGAMPTFSTSGAIPAVVGGVTLGLRVA